MATKGRDLKVSFLTDLDRFDTDKVAKGLDDVADSADTTGRGLDKLAKDTDRAGDKFTELAKDTDRAFDKIAAASKSGTRKVGDDLDGANEGLGEFKDEAAGTTREVAASFGSVEDALGGIQEVAANAFAGFGPAGAAAGAAAAVGMGFLTSALQKSTDEANAVKDRVIDLAQAIDEAGGNLDAVDLEGRMRDWSLEIADNKSWWELWQKSNLTNLELVKNKADETGVAFADLFRGMAGTDPEAAKRSLDALNQKLDENAQAMRRTEAAYDGRGRSSSDTAIKLRHEKAALDDAKDALLAHMNVSEDALNLAALQAEAVGRSAKAQEDAATALQEHTSALEAHAQALDGFVEPAGIYAQLLADKTAAEQASAEATAAATADQKDSWEDYAKSVTVSVDDYLAELERQVAAQEAWSTNLQTLAKRGVTEGVLAELEKMGPEGAPLVAKLTKASDAELTKLVALYARQGSAAGSAVASNLTGQVPAVGTAARRVHDAAARELARSIVIPVKLNDLTAETRRALADAQAYARAHPVYATVKNTAPGHTRDVP